MRRIGEVAAATGLTVRTLHHYDEIGLLAPSGHSERGYRLYSDADLERLYRIVALRRLGFPLAEIGALLDADGADPRPLVRAQLERLDEEAQLRARLRERLTSLLVALESADGAAADLFIDAIEGMTMYEKHYTPQQLETLAQRRGALGEDGMRRAEADWSALIADAEAERAAGTDPADPRVQPLVDRWQTLIEAFTGGDAGIAASLKAMYEVEGPERASRGAVNGDLMAWMGRAMAARR
jgi:DNA-binding transcriptional MerR regulator